MSNLASAAELATNCRKFVGKSEAVFLQGAPRCGQAGPVKKLVQNTSFVEQARAPYKLRRETPCTWVPREPPEENQRMVLLNGALSNANGVREVYMLQVAVTGSPGQR